MKYFLLSLCVVVAGFGSSPVLSESTSHPSTGDPRIQYMDYDKDEVFLIKLKPNVGTLVLFGEGEKITDVGIDDPSGLDFTHTANEDGFFFEYRSPNITHMIVITTQRVYTLLLDSQSTDGQFYSQIRFNYDTRQSDLVFNAPAESSLQGGSGDDFGKLVNTLPTRYEANIEYNWKGDIEILPEMVFDNGLYTFFKFKTEVPAIFEVMKDRKERIINRHRDGELVVIHKVAKQLTLRLGDYQVCLFNMDIYNKQKLYKASGVFNNDYQTTSRN